jgi:phage/plasmid-associated DNA primase
MKQQKIILLKMIVLKYIDEIPSIPGFVFENNIMIAYVDNYIKNDAIIYDQTLDDFFDMISLFEITVNGDRVETHRLFRDIFTEIPINETPKTITIEEDITFTERYMLFIINEYGGKFKNHYKKHNFISMLKGFGDLTNYIISCCPYQYILDEWDSVPAYPTDRYSFDFYFYYTKLYLPENKTNLFEFYLRKCTALLNLNDIVTNTVICANLFCCIYSERIMKHKDNIYFFENHGWVLYKDLGNTLTYDFKEEIVSFRNYLLQKSIQTDFLTKFIAMINSSIDYLTKVCDVRSLCMLIRNRLVDAASTITMDQKHYLLCKDGVYNYKRQKFVDGNPSQFCTFRANVYWDYRNIEKNTIKYESFYDSDEEEDLNVQKKSPKEKYEEAQNDVVYFFESVFPDEAIREYILTYLCNIFRFGNRDKIFLIFRGSGDNAKTVLTNILQDILHDYVNTPPTSQLTRPRTTSSAATSDWVDNHNKRFLMYLEMEKSTSLNEGVLKFLTGGEANMNARALYKDIQKITINANVIISCNNTWTISTVDTAIKNRLVIVPFETKFVEPKQVYKKNEKPKIPNFIEKVQSPYFKCAFLHYVAQYVSKFECRNLAILPERMQKIKNIFIESADEINNFIIKNCVEQSGQQICINLLWERYRNYFNQVYPNKRLNFDLNQFMKLLEERGFSINNDMLYDYMFTEDVRAMENNIEYNDILKDMGIMTLNQKV